MFGDVLSGCRKPLDLLKTGCIDFSFQIFPVDVEESGLSFVVLDQ